MTEKQSQIIVKVEMDIGTNLRDAIRDAARCVGAYSYNSGKLVPEIIKAFGLQELLVKISKEVTNT